MKFAEVADRADLNYGPAAHQIAQLSDGRGKDPGLKLLLRIRDEPTSRANSVAVSRKGQFVACRFASRSQREATREQSPFERQQALSAHLVNVISPAFQTLISHAPAMSLGTLCVLLHVTRNQEKFGYHGSTLKEVFEAHDISNLPRHMAILSHGTPKREGLGLIEYVSKPEDRRVSLPKLTGNGLELMVSISSKLLQRSPAKLRRPKRKALKNLSTPESVGNLTPEDYKYFDPENLPKLDKT